MQTDENREADTRICNSSLRRPQVQHATNIRVYTVEPRTSNTIRSRRRFDFRVKFPHKK
jgi:hypothetical protein